MQQDTPVNVSAVVDPQASMTDIFDSNFLPSNAQELEVAIKNLLQGSGLNPADAYSIIKGALQKGEQDMKQTKLESIIRNQIRSILSEAAPMLPPRFMTPAMRQDYSRIIGKEVTPDYMFTDDDMSAIAAHTSKTEKPYKKAKTVEPLKAATNPLGVQPRRVTHVDRPASSEKYRTQLASALKTMDMGDEVAEKTPAELAKSASVSESVRFIEDAVRNDADRFMDVVDETESYFVEFFESEEGDEYTPAEQEDTLRNLTESDYFKQAFKEEFGKTYMEYMYPLGQAIKDVLSSGGKFSLSRDATQEDLVGTKEVAMGLGVSGGTLDKIENVALAKWVLESSSGI